MFLLKMVCFLSIFSLLLSCASSPKNSETLRSSSEASTKILTIKETPRIVASSDYQTTTTGLKYYDFQVGSGAKPRTGQTVEVHYTGWLKNGTSFDSSLTRGRPLSFPIGVRRVILGWDEGVGSMKVGGYRQLIVPARLAYGERGAGDQIPPNATLIFEVQLLNIKGP